jgi:DNA-binding NarL/FixJ family response regulator
LTAVSLACGREDRVAEVLGSRGRASTDANTENVGDDCRVPLSVLIVDDHAGFRRSARGLLEAEGLRVVGEAADGLEAIDLVRVIRPDIVLLDVQLPGLDGFEVAERLAELVDPPIVVLISSRDAGTYRGRLADSPARAFIAKRDLTGDRLASLAS